MPLVPHLIPCHEQVAKNASAAAEGLCTWVQAMKFYHEASKIVKPKLEALAVAEGQMDAANKVGTLSLIAHCSKTRYEGGWERIQYSRCKDQPEVNNFHRRVGRTIHAGDGGGFAQGQTVD